jgi:hypothetical protein
MWSGIMRCCDRSLRRSMQTNGSLKLKVRWGIDKTAVTQTPETAPLRHAFASQCADERLCSRVIVCGRNFSLQ